MTTAPPNDDDLVYVDPALRQVIGPVEYTKDGQPKALPYGNAQGDTWRKHYPWGTYRSMKRAFRLEGKYREEKGSLLLDSALPKALNDEL